QLRELNIIKEHVRASFNLDSSVENSNQHIDSASECFNQNPKLLTVPYCGRRSNPISTPCEKRLRSNLFQCALSPITGMKLDGLLAEANPKLSENGNGLEIHGHVCFEQSILSVESTDESEHQPKRSRKISKEIPIQIRKSSLVLQPGKWRKSLSTWRRTILHDAPCRSNQKQSLPSTGVSHLPQRKSIYNPEAQPDLRGNYEKKVLRYCRQQKALRFGSTYTSAKMLGACKIGEGVYGEVFKYTPKNNPNTSVVLKCIPIEGDVTVNGETQKTYEQILPEIIISKEMSNLRGNATNSTSGFVDIHKVCLVKGKYPQHLIRLWEEYDDKKESENEHPEMFTESQLFIVLELKYAGEDMSRFMFADAEQSYHALQQIILTLAVGEEAFQFEHRDLHTGNILIEATEDQRIAYKLRGKDLSVASKGIRITIIDYTLSRVTVDSCCHYNDLASDEELFEATGDYQYDIYRLMRDELQNNWSRYAPRTNVLWLSYVVSKLIDGVIYENPKSRAHQRYVQKLRDFSEVMLTFDTAVACAEYIHNKD
ncbi:hypothetical protein KR222_003721, partial [Zaprionus bogoriensis]